MRVQRKKWCKSTIIPLLTFSLHASDYTTSFRGVIRKFSCLEKLIHAVLNSLLYFSFPEFSWSPDTSIGSTIFCILAAVLGWFKFDLNFDFPHHLITEDSVMCTPMLEVKSIHAQLLSLPFILRSNKGWMIEMQWMHSIVNTVNLAHKWKK
jgi:hypothetical protein